MRKKANSELHHFKMHLINNDHGDKRFSICDLYLPKKFFFEPLLRSLSRLFVSSLNFHENKRC